MELKINVLQLFEQGTIPNYNTLSPGELINIVIEREPQEFLMEPIDLKFVLQNLLSTIQTILKQNSGVKIQDICFQGSMDLTQYTTPNNALSLRKFCEIVAKDITKLKYCDGLYTPELLQELTDIAESQRLFIDIGDIHSAQAMLFADPDIANSIIAQSLFIGNFSSEQNRPLNALDLVALTSEEGISSGAQPKKKRGRFDLSDQSSLHLDSESSASPASTKKPDQSASEASESVDVCNLEDNNSIRDSKTRAFNRAIKGLDADKAEELKALRRNANSG